MPPSENTKASAEAKPPTSSPAITRRGRRIQLGKLPRGTQYPQWPSRGKHSGPGWCAAQAVPSRRAEWQHGAQPLVAQPETAPEEERDVDGKQCLAEERVP